MDVKEKRDSSEIDRSNEKEHQSAKRSVEQGDAGQNENARLLRIYMKALLGEHAAQDIARKWDDRRDYGKNPEETM